MQVYSPADMADILQIKTATLRKYSMLLEKYGYNIARNSQGHRYYQDKDIITLRNVIAGVGGDVTLEKSVINVVKLGSYSDVTNDINNDDAPNDSEIQELKYMIAELAKKIDNQSEQIQKQTDYINRYIEDDRGQIEESKDKRGFWRRLFNR